MTGLFKWLLLASVLVGCTFLESCPFPLGCWICSHADVHRILLWFFFIYTLLVHSSFSFLILLICLFRFSLFCSWWTSPEVCQFCLPFQISSSWFDWFFSIFQSLFYFLSGCYYFLPSAEYKICLFFFLVILGGSLGHLFGIFLAILRKAYNAMNFLIITTFVISHRFAWLCFLFLLSQGILKKF